MAVSAKPLPCPTAADRPRGARSDYAVVGALAALPVLAAIAEAPAALTAGLALPVLAAVQWCVSRRGGWRLIGPHSYYDLIRMSRKGRIVLFRTLFLCVVVAAIYYTYERYRPDRASRPPGWFEALLHGEERAINRVGPPPALIEDSADVRAVLRQRLALLNMDCVNVWFLLQNVAILLLAPAYLGGAIAEERDRGTLQMLLSTRLYNREIVLGKLAARLALLGMFLLAGLPIFSIMLVWGGIDLPLLLAHWSHSAVLLVTVGCVCTMLSTIPVRASTCVIAGYLIALPIGWARVTAWQGGLLDFRLSTAGTRSPGFAVLCGLATFYAVTIVVSLVVAIKGLRVPDLPTLAAAVFPPPNATQEVRAYTGPSLPRIRGNALLWKERYTGGKSVLLLPQTVLLLAMPVSLTLWLGLPMVIDRVVAARPQGLPEALAELTNTLGASLRATYVFFLVAYCIGVAFRAAGCVVRERQRRTLDLLLQLPVRRSDILHAKWRGAVYRGRPWLALLAGNVTVGLLIGAYHPLSAVLLVVVPVPLVFALCSIGLVISVVARTAVQANVVMAGVMVPLTGFTLGVLLGTSLVCTWWQGLTIQSRDIGIALFSMCVLVPLGGFCWHLAIDAFRFTTRR